MASGDPEKRAESGKNAPRADFSDLFAEKSTLGARLGPGCPGRGDREPGAQAPIGTRVPRDSRAPRDSRVPRPAAVPRRGLPG